MKLKLFLTFDHELPLGSLKTSYKDSLFDPTQKIIDIADELGVKVVLFTDILCALRFKEWDYSNFYLPYINQLKTVLNQGHDVQLHIHPHWLTTEYKNNTYSPSNDFALSVFKDDVEYGGIDGIINKSVRGLNAICLPLCPDYKCVAFRAGGFDITSSGREIFQSLYKHGIRFDSSMVRGHYYKSAISEIDFRNLPDAPNWYINPENYHIASASKGVFEIPIATMPKNIFEVPTMFKLKKYSTRAPIKHGDIVHFDNEINIFEKIVMLLSDRLLSFDNYTLSLDYLLRIVEYNINKYKSADTIMLSIISHPKSMGDYSFELMRNFILEIKNKYSNVEFLTFSDLNTNIE